MKTSDLLLLAGGAVAAYYAYDKFLKPAVDAGNTVSNIYNSGQGTLYGIETGASVAYDNFNSAIFNNLANAYNLYTGIDLTPSGIAQTLFGWI